MRHDAASSSFGESDLSINSMDSGMRNDRVIPLCWRNVFSVVNYLRVIQMLVKRRGHRILMLMQYKAPVRCFYLYV